MIARKKEKSLKHIWPLLIVIGVVFGVQALLFWASLSNDSLTKDTVHGVYKNLTDLFDFILKPVTGFLTIVGAILAYRKFWEEKEKDRENSVKVQEMAKVNNLMQLLNLHVPSYLQFTASPIYTAERFQFQRQAYNIIAQIEKVPGNKQVTENYRAVFELESPIFKSHLERNSEDKE